MIYVPVVYIIGAGVMFLYSLVEWANVKEDEKLSKIFKHSFNDWIDNAIISTKDIFGED